MYHMAGNFHGVLIFVVHSPVTKLSIHTCTAISAEGRPTRGTVKTSWQCCRTAPSNKLSLRHHCHLADGIFNSRVTLVHAIHRHTRGRGVE